MESLLTFNAETHTYRLGSRVLPSVTTILREAGLSDFSASWFTPEARERGTRVHAAIEALLNDEEAPVDDDLVPYVAAFMQWRRDEPLDITGTEVRLHDADLGYAGTIDITGEKAVDYPLSKALHYVIDVKTGFVPPSVGPQTAAYARLLDPTKWWFRASLNLRRDGTYRYELLEDDGDEDDFMAALRLYHRRRSKYGTRI